MKYIVTKTGEHASEKLFIFPQDISHDKFLSMMCGGFMPLDPKELVVSAGFVQNYRSEDGMDQIRLSGSSTTLKVHSRPEDLELFRRLTNGY